MLLTEEEIATLESEEIDKADSYFGARDPHQDTWKNRRFFTAGFERGYKAAFEKFKSETGFSS